MALSAEKCNTQIYRLQDHSTCYFEHDPKKSLSVWLSIFNVC